MPYEIKKFLRDTTIGVIGSAALFLAANAVSVGIPAELIPFVVPGALLVYRTLRTQYPDAFDFDEAGV